MPEKGNGKVAKVLMPRPRMAKAPIPCIKALITARGKVAINIGTNRGSSDAPRKMAAHTHTMRGRGPVDVVVKNSWNIRRYVTMNRTTPASKARDKPTR